MSGRLAARAFEPSLGSLRLQVLASCRATLLRRRSPDHCLRPITSISQPFELKRLKNRLTRSKAALLAAGPRRAIRLYALAELSLKFDKSSSLSNRSRSLRSWVSTEGFRLAPSGKVLDFGPQLLKKHYGGTNRALSQLAVNRNAS